MLAATALGFLLGATFAAFVLFERRRPHPWTLPIRIPPLLHKQLRGAAHVHGLSLNSEIEQRLWRSFERSTVEKNNANVVPHRRSR